MYWSQESINYDESKCVFKMGTKKDYHLFVIWEKARFKEVEIINDIRDNFTIIDCIEVEWSDLCVDDNFLRVYGVAPTGNESEKKIQVGSGKFLVVLIEDEMPVYQYRFDVSRRFKIVNTKVVDKKNEYRAIVGGSYLIHSTNDPAEFFTTYLLMFGVDRINLVLEGSLSNLFSRSEPFSGGKYSALKEDLIGSTGWDSVEHLFSVLNMAVEYVVLRGPEKVVVNSRDLIGDIDILCSDLDSFASISNAKNIWNSDNFFHVVIEDKPVLFDIRYVGDDYFDREWQKDILKNRVLYNGMFYVPRLDDYLFSHLYHALVHKDHFYEKYLDRLNQLAQGIHIEELISKNMLDVEKSIDVLRGFLKNNSYRVSIPKDVSVCLNVENISRIKTIGKTKLYLKVVIRRFESMLRSFYLRAKSLIKENKSLYIVLRKVISKFR